MGSVTHGLNWTLARNAILLEGRRTAYAGQKSADIRVVTGAHVVHTWDVNPEQHFLLHLYVQLEHTECDRLKNVLLLIT